MKLSRICLVFACMAAAQWAAAYSYTVRAVDRLATTLKELAAVALKPDAAFADMVTSAALPVVIGRDEVRAFDRRRLERMPDRSARAPLSCAFVAAA